MSGAERPGLGRFAWLSIGAAVSTIALKVVAWRLTLSVGLLSDALESVVNLVAAVMTLWMLTLSARPADEDHAYGYTKAEYFGSGAEGALILLAAAGIAWTAIDRLISPRPVDHAAVGLLVSGAASLVNLSVSRVLMRAARLYQSIALEADAHHLMTDVWTSAGVIAGVAIVALTGWQRLDPLVALLVAANIVRIGAQLVRRSALGLIDAAVPKHEQQAIRDILARHERESIRFHAVRTRQAGARRFVSMHVLVPGHWTVLAGHDLAERIETEIRSALGNVTILTHVEPIEHSSSYEDIALDRGLSR